MTALVRINPVDPLGAQRTDINQTPSCDLIERDENAADIITSNFSPAILLFVRECAIFSRLIHRSKKLGGG